MHLTQTDKKGRERKSELIERIRSALDEKDRLFLFAHENMRNANLQAVRSELSDSRSAPSGRTRAYPGPAL